MTRAEQFVQVIADMSAHYLADFSHLRIWNTVPRAVYDALLPVLALAAAEHDDYPRGFQLCRTDNEDALFAAEETLSQAEYCYWSAKHVVDGVEYLIGFEYGD